MTIKNTQPQTVREHDADVSREYVESRDPFTIRDTRTLQLNLARAQARVRVLTAERDAR
ncbi:MAG: hypothetical protein M3458_14845 [Acidobacteriota bacterium]|nr:hypothetical protein [Acidobacteriota bacterium]